MYKSERQIALALIRKIVDETGIQPSEALSVSLIVADKLVKLLPSWGSVPANLQQFSKTDERYREYWIGIKEQLY